MYKQVENKCDKEDSGFEIERVGISGAPLLFFFHHDIHFQDYMIRAISAKERENARTYSWLLKH